jgi:hypothetical protein
VVPEEAGLKGEEAEGKGYWYVAVERGVGRSEDEVGF